MIFIAGWEQRCKSYAAAHKDGQSFAGAAAVEGLTDIYRLKHGVDLPEYLLASRAKRKLSAHKLRHFRYHAG